MPTRSLLIAAPTMSGLIKIKTAESIISVVKTLTRSGINADVINVDSSDIVTARNHYANLLLRSNDWDALLFIDSDMQFSADLVVRMINFDAEIVAAAYPKRALDLAAFSAAVRDHGDINRAMSQGVDFNVLATWEETPRGRLEVRAGFAKMVGVGMGCCLISKTALTAMISLGAVNTRIDLRSGNRAESFGFFDYVDYNGITLTEDFAFCFRWTKTLGRDVWVCIDTPVGHIGDFSYRGVFLDRTSRSD